MSTFILDDFTDNDEHNDDQYDQYNDQQYDHQYDHKYDHQYDNQYDEHNDEYNDEHNDEQNNDRQNIILEINKPVRLIPPKFNFQHTLSLKKEEEEISYDDILKSMNLYIKNGKLYKIQNQTKQNEIKQNEIKQNVYKQQIYKEKLYRRLLLLQQLKKQSQQKNYIRNIKSKKLNLINMNNTNFIDNPKINLKMTRM